MTRFVVFITAACFSFGTVLAQPAGNLSSFRQLEGIWKMGSGEKSFFEEWQSVWV
jgi:hypothetical protein